MKKTCLLTAWLLASAASVLAAVDASLPARDPAQKVDEEYSKKIREYTTEAFFLSPLVEYLPASEKVPTPKTVLGDVAGAPGKLPYSAEVYRYMRMLEAASPRVKVRSIGTTEEGREMIVVALAYRLAVDESPYVKFIRDSVITLITPVVEADGRDKQVDIYNWHLAHPR